MFSHVEYESKGLLTTFTKAISCDEAQQWSEAISSKYELFNVNQVFKVVDRTDDMNVIDTRWIFTNKYDTVSSRRVPGNNTRRGIVQHQKVGGSGNITTSAHKARLHYASTITM